MKKYLGLSMAGLLVAGLTFMVPATGMAASTFKTFTAAASVTGGVVAMNLSLNNISNDAPVANMGWTGVTAGQQWTLANQYVLINATTSIAGSALKTYTNNKAAGASPLYAGSTTTAAGLVSSDGQTTLPMEWHLLSAKSTSTVVPMMPFDLLVNPNPPSNQAYTWNWYAEQGPSLVIGSDADKYMSLMRAGVGLQLAQMGFFAPSNPPPFYLYVAANFATAAGGMTYSTNQLTFELYQP